MAMGPHRLQAISRSAEQAESRAGNPPGWRSALRQALRERSLLGLVAGTVLLGASLTPSLTPRPPELMGVLAGICLALGYLAGIAVRAAYSFLGFALPQVRGGLTRLIVVACAGFAAAFFWLSIDWQNQLRTLFDLPPLGRGSVFVVVAMAIATFGLLFLIGVGCRALYRITSAWFDKRVPRRVVGHPAGCMGQQRLAGRQAPAVGKHQGLQGLHLLVQQGVGALQFLVSQQQPLYAFGDLVKVLGIGHGYDMLLPHCRVAARATRLQCALLVLAVWFTCRSSTGSRRESPHGPT